MKQAFKPQRGPEGHQRKLKCEIPEEMTKGGIITMKKLATVISVVALALTFTLVGQVAAQTCVPPPAGLVSWWPGDGDASDIADNNPGALIGNTAFAPGKVGQGFNLPGGTSPLSRVEVADAPNLQITGPFTLDAWVSFSGINPATPGISNAPIVGKWGSTISGTGGYGLFVFANGIANITVSSNGFTTFGVNSPNPLPINTFAHVAGVFTGTDIELYVNGALVATTPFNGSVHNNIGVPVLIGGYSTAFSTGLGDSMVGAIDEVEIYNRALSAGEIQAIFNAGSAGKCKPLGHFLAHNVEETEGTPEFESLTVSLTDQFESGSFEVKEPRTLLNPADKNGEGISDPDTHLVGYEIERAEGEPEDVKRTNIKVENQFGVLFLDTEEPDLLLVPSAKGFTPPIAALDPETVDHFKCYKVEVTEGTPEFPEGIQVTVGDQFTDPPKVFNVKEPERLCNPVEKQVGLGPPVLIKNPEGHLVCYEVEEISVAGIHVNNQFGPLQLDAVIEKELCVPSKKTFPAP